MLPIFDWLKNGTFQPKLDKNFFFSQYYLALYGQMQRKRHKFIRVVAFELIENVLNTGTKHL